MGAIIFAFVAGVIVACATIAYMNYQLATQKSNYERSLSVSNGDLQKYRLDEAYRNGISSEKVRNEAKTRLLEGQVAVLRQENEQLREQLSTAGIFAGALMENGGAAIHLRRINRV